MQITTLRWNTSRLRSRAAQRIAAALLAGLAVVPAGVLNAAPAHAAGLDITAMEAHFVDLLNADRVRNGLPSLRVNPTLSNIARDGQIQMCGGPVRGRSQDMVDRNYFSHQVPPCGSYVWPDMSAAGVQWSGAGENIGWNNYPAASTVDQMEVVLYNSPGHRANILGDFNQVGVGIAASSGIFAGVTGAFVFTQIFAKAPLPTVAGQNGYTVDGFGGVHAIGAAPAIADSSHAYWQGWDIVRGLAVCPDKASGYTLDGWGGIHSFGGAPTVADASHAYWPFSDIARSIALVSCTRTGAAGYVLDGFGGVHEWNTGDAPRPAVVPDSSHAYWQGWDIAGSLALCPGGAGGYTLDGWGGVHAFGGAAPVADSSHAYWQFWDIARGLVVTACTAGGADGYTLDGFGGVHRFGNAVDVPDVTHAYWPGQDIARGITWLPNGGGYVVDGYGGIHPFTPGASEQADVTSSGYWPGWNITRGISS